MKAEEVLRARLGIPTVIEMTATPHGTIRSIVAGKGRDVVLLHGLNVGWGEWYPNIVALAEHFTVHALDLPGAGGSSFVHSREKDFGGRLVGAVHDYLHEKKFSSVHLVGHSLGAWIALKIMLEKCPLVDKAIVISPLGFSEQTPPKYRAIGAKWLAQLLSKTAMRPNRKNLAFLTSDVFYNKEKVDPTFVDYYYESFTEGGLAHPFLIMNRFAGVRRVRDEFNLIGQVDAIDRPVMIIAGEEDPVVPWNEAHQRAFAKIPGAAIRSIAESGHVPSTEQAEAVNRLIVNFLKA